MIDICVSCGTIQTLNLDALKEDVRAAEKELKEGDEDSDGDGDSSYNSEEDE